MNTMAENKAFESIMRGLTESLEYAKGDSSKARKMSVTVAELPQYRESGRNIPQGTAQRFLQLLQMGGKKMLQDYNVVAVTM